MQERFATVWMMRLLWPILALVVILSGWSQALAAPRDPEVPLPSAKNDWRSISRDAKATTSTCIGKTTTPVCAAETAEACVFRRDKELCRIAAGPLTMYLLEMNLTSSLPLEFIRVASARKLTKKDLRSERNLSSDEVIRRIGDIEMDIEYMYGACDSDRACRLARPADAFILRRTGPSRWSVAAIGSCAARDMDDPGSFCPGWYIDDSVLRDGTLLGVEAPLMAKTHEKRFPPRIADQHWLAIGPNASSSTIPCVGSAHTPFCLVATMEACLLRGEKQLCETANAHSMLHPPADFRFSQPIDYFRMAAFRQLHEADLARYEMKGAGLRQAGDFQIELEHLGLRWGSDGSFRQEKAVNTYLVRRSGAQWMIAARINCVADGDDVSLCPGWVPPLE